MSFDLGLGLDGKVAIITGAGGGIGSSTVKAFLAAGVSVIATDVNTTPLERLDSRDMPGKLVVTDKDLSTVDACQELITETTESLGKVDILVNCAALIQRIDLADMDEATWDRHMDINLKSTFFLSKLAGENMRQRKWGRIINMTSLAGYTGGLNCVAYAATKGGINTLTKSFARHYAEFGITVNAVSPALVDTSMIRDTLSEDAINNLIAMVPIKRLSKPGEIATPILFLASRWADSINGITLDVNGGMLMR